jgi:hypothetical protein
MLQSAAIVHIRIKMKSAGGTQGVTRGSRAHCPEPRFKILSSWEFWEFAVERENRKLDEPPGVGRRPCVTVGPEIAWEERTGNGGGGTLPIAGG